MARIRFLTPSMILRGSPRSSSASTRPADSDASTPSPAPRAETPPVSPHTPAPSAPKGLLRPTAKTADMPMSDELAELHREFARYDHGFFSHTDARPAADTELPLHVRVQELWRHTVSLRPRHHIKRDALHDEAVRIPLRYAPNTKYSYLDTLTFMNTQPVWKWLRAPQRREVARVFADAADLYPAEDPRHPGGYRLRIDLLKRSLSYDPDNVQTWAALSEALSAHGDAPEQARRVHVRTLQRARDQRRRLGDTVTPAPSRLTLPFYPELGAAFYASYVATFRDDPNPRTREAVRRATLIGTVFSTDAT
jgi:hypothetical protein